MRVSLAWLAEWIDLPADLEALAEQLTMAGVFSDHFGSDIETHPTASSKPDKYTP